jgi:hypothetical protein
MVWEWDDAKDGKTVKVVIHYRHRDAVREEMHKPHDAWKLVTTYNRTAYDAHVIDVWCERVN